MIHPIPGIRGAQAYLVRSEEETIVIDPGYTGSYRAVLRFMDSTGVAGIDWVLLTHHHIDHAGTAFALCQATGARLALHEADAPYLRAGRPRERITIWGLADRLPPRLASYLVSCASCDVRMLADDETVAGLTVIHAPGHTPGSIALWSAAESALFAGDILNNERGLRTPPWTVNHRHRQARLAPHRLRGLRFERAFFGHGPAILEGADQRVDAFLNRIVSAGSSRRLGRAEPPTAGQASAPNPPNAAAAAGEHRPAG
jgi:glyoxylase-like metal-dependent hydrolase (beta-lactamase superfamily II)